jgi:hypothetical protein
MGVLAAAAPSAVTELDVVGQGVTVGIRRAAEVEPYLQRRRAWSGFTLASSRGCWFAAGEGEGDGGTGVFWGAGGTDCDTDGVVGALALSQPARRPTRMTAPLPGGTNRSLGMRGTPFTNLIEAW